jgi:hypothetical protein
MTTLNDVSNVVDIIGSNKFIGTPQDFINLIDAYRTLMNGLEENQCEWYQEKGSCQLNEELEPYFKEFKERVEKHYKPGHAI